MPLEQSHWRARFKADGFPLSGWVGYQRHLHHGHRAARTCAMAAQASMLVLRAAQCPVISCKLLCDGERCWCLMCRVDGGHPHSKSSRGLRPGVSIASCRQFIHRTHCDGQQRAWKEYRNMNGAHLQQETRHSGHKRSNQIVIIQIQGNPKATLWAIGLVV